MDPRLKFDALDEWLQVIYNEDQIKIEEIENEVNSLLYILYNIYKEKYGNNISLIKSSSTTSSSSFYKNPLEMFKSRKKATTSFPNNTTDIDRYLSVETVTPRSRASVDYPSTRGIQVDVGLPDTTSDNRAESPLYGELYPIHHLHETCPK